MRPPGGSAGRVEPKDLYAQLQQGASLALIDVREHGEYNAAHIPGSSLVPRRELEKRMGRLVPWRGARVVVVDDDGRRAELAARTLSRMGYERVEVLEGGLNRWASERLPTEWGVNVVSKDFGEKVEVQDHVATIEATELHRRLESGEDIVILDTRTPEEYSRFCIPGGRNVPGGELALRVTDILKERPGGSVVVNCAGRTRSIIGARVLQRMGLPVVSLKNGTSGWVLAGYQLEQGARRFELPEPSPEGLAAAEAFAARVGREDGVRQLSIDQLRDLLGRRDQQCVYLVDVRTEHEFAEGHIPGFWWFPGGQAVQRADDVAAVRDATIVFCCDGTARSTITASWYRQMGFPNVYAVTGGTRAWQAAGLPLEAGMAEEEPFGLAKAVATMPSVTPEMLRGGQLPGAPIVLFLGTSREFAEGHVPGAHWAPRGWLEVRIQSLAPHKDAPLVLTDADGSLAPLAAVALRELGYTQVLWLRGGMRAWHQAAMTCELGLSGVMSAPDDVLPAGLDRSYAGMIEYLRWEEALGAKYAPQGSTTH